jgi:hypothetical protein
MVWGLVVSQVRVVWPLASARWMLPVMTALLQAALT